MPQSDGSGLVSAISVLLDDLIGLDDHPVMIGIGVDAGEVLLHLVAGPGRSVVQQHGAVGRLRH